MRTPLELAWAAGFFDGEGHIGARKGETAAWRIIVQLNQTDRAVLDRFRAAVGVGLIWGPRSRNNPRHKDIYFYRAGGFEQSQAVIAMLWPFLSAPKRQQAALALRQMIDWHADRDAWCRSRRHLIAEVGLTAWRGSCRGCYIESRRRQRERAKDLKRSGSGTEGPR